MDVLGVLGLAVMTLAPVPWPPGAMSQRASSLATSQRMEAFTLVAGPDARVGVDVLDARVTVRLPTAQARAAARVVAGRSVLCPYAKVVRGGLQLQCLGPQVTARLSRRGTDTVLVLRELRGVAVHHKDLQLPAFWTQLAREARCDSTQPLDRALCQLSEGRTNSALKTLALAQFKAGQRATASIILGSLAEERGEDAKAMAWYRQALADNQWLSLVRVTDCELGGVCGPLMAGRPGASLNALPPRLKDLVALRRARVMAFKSPRPHEGAAVLAAVVEQGSSMQHPCTQLWQTCHTILAQSLQASGDNPVAAATAVESYLKVVVGEEHSDTRLRAAALAARRMEELGAPGPAAVLLSAHTPVVPRSALEEHLATTVRLFLDAGDAPRASTVRLYATQVVGARRLAAEPWRSLDVRLAPVASAGVPPQDVSASQEVQRRVAMELAAARTLTARARGTTALASTTSGN